MRRILISIAVLGLTLGLTACSNDTVSPDPVAPAIDTAPPVSPTGLLACSDADLVKVAWDANVTDPDLAGYRLTRTGRGMTVALIDDPIDVLRFDDDHPFEGVAVYAVTAVDAAGNESPAATITVDFYAGEIPELERR